jgi:mono/diheme cytochrome c family protein
MRDDSSLSIGDWSFSLLPAARCLLLAASCLLVVIGCRQQMADQPSYRPLQKSSFFGDERSARPLIPGTVAQGQLKADEPFSTGKSGGELITALPVPLTKELLVRGRERFNIFCSPCHDRTGGGNGMIAQRGYRHPPSYHIDRLRQAPIGHFFDVITNGFGAMSDYAAQIPPADRWAIAAYIRALQLSQNATLADVPPEARPQIEGKQP